jgi:peptidylprolyl isomerase
MKQTVLILLLAASSSVAVAQAAAKPETTAPKPVTAAHKSSATDIKLPPGVPPVRGVKKPLFTLRYQEIKIGSGAVAESNKLYKVHYTGWLAADGRKFDSSYDHPRPPVLDKDGKPILGEDGKPKQSEPQPITFPQGFGRVIPGWDQGFEGMRIGGQRRLFIPYELAYGAKGRPGPDADHPGIPPRADLIFDVELVDVIDLPKPANHPGMMNGGHPAPGSAAPKFTAPGAPATPTAPGSAQKPPVSTTTAAPTAPKAATAPAAVPAPTAPASPTAPATPSTPAQPQAK